MIMEATVADIIDLVNTYAPVELAEDWDNVGLQIGNRNWPVRTLWVALDPLPGVVEEACKHNVDLLITHHPLIFRPLHGIDIDTPLGSILKKAIEHQMAFYTAHTNLDTTIGGLNDVLAARVGLKNVVVLAKTKTTDTQEGFGRIGILERRTDLADFAKRVKQILRLPYVKIAGKLDLSIYKVAVCSGSGSSLLDTFLASEAQVYLTGDLRYHDARAAEAANRGLIDIGHFASEHLIVEVLADILHDRLQEKGFTVKVKACCLEKDPFMIV